jgi:hypothetical protein
MKNEKSGVEDLTSTLVGMEPIDVEEVPGEIAQPEMAPVRRPRAPDEPAFLPEPPKDLRATGLKDSLLEELCLKHLFQAGDLKGGEIIRRICLPAGIVEAVMEHLRKNHLVDIKGSSGAGLGRSQMIFQMTEAGHKVCQHAMERDRYLGPAPVPFAYYTQAVAAQSIRGNRLRRADIEPHFGDLVVREEVFDAIGPAMNSG